jgi:hypothetical protein
MILIVVQHEQRQGNLANSIRIINVEKSERINK